jgi:hypothetical protein
VSGESMPIIHDVESASKRAKVSEAVILQWVREGLRATPVGSVGKRGPREYRIFDSWLVEFMERRATVSRPEGATPPAPAPAKRKAAAGKLTMPKLPRGG